MSGDFDSDVSFGKVRRKQTKLRTRDDSVAPTFEAETSDAELEQETLQLKPKSSQRGKKSAAKPGLSFNEEEEAEPTFKLNKTGVKTKKKKVNLFDDSIAPSATPTSSHTDDMYSTENLAKLRSENLVQFVVKPLQRTEENEDEMLRYVDATELAPSTSATIQTPNADDDAMSFDKDEEMFRSKQVEAAKLLRAKMRQSDAVIHEEVHVSDAYDTRKPVSSDKMAVDDEDEAQEDDFSDGEAAERHAIDAEQPFTGRHYFQDAVQKKKNDAMETVRGREAEADQFFNAPDADDIEWELELLKRSGVKRTHQTASSGKMNIPSGKSGEKRVEIEAIPERAVEPISEEEILRRIENDIAQLESISSLHENRLGSIERAKEEHLEFLTKTADSAFTKASDDLKFFEELKLYVVDLMDCVESKLPLIGAVEEQVFAAKTARLKRTQLATKNVFQDEFMRISSKKATNSTENTKWIDWREKRKAKRGGKVRENGQMRLEDPQLELEEGYSSDEETTEEDQLTYDTKMEGIRQAAGEVFEDAMDEFRDLGLILSRMADFRRLYQFSYQQSHMQSELVTLLSPFVRLETVSWDPLKNLAVFDWPWLGALDDFDAEAQSLSSSDTASSTQMDTNGGNADRNNTRAPLESHLLADVASTVLHSRVKDAIKFFWRPNCKPETQVLQDLLGKFRGLFAPKLLSELLMTVHATLQHAIMIVNLPLTYQADQLSDYGKVAFTRILKLIDITKAWKPYFAHDAISNLVWNTAVNDKLVPYLRCISKDKMQTWKLTSLLLACVAPLYRESSSRQLGDERMNTLNAFVKELEQASMGHYETFEMSQSAVDFWASCTK